MRNFFAVFALVLLATGAQAAVQTKDQQKCINTFNKDTAKWSKAFNKNLSKCVKDGTTGKVGDVQACVEGDPKGKKGKADLKLRNNEAKNCTAEVPEFGYSDANTAVMGANDQGLAMVSGIFGPTVQAASKAADKAGAACQIEVTKVAGKAFDAKWKAAVKAKKNSLKGKGVPPATASGELQTAMVDGVDADPKVVKALAKLASQIDKKCAGQDLASLFPGDCPSGSTAAFGACVDEITECRFCRALNAADAFGIDCDLFDNGVADASCSLGGGSVFVSDLTGNDGNPGTRDEPVATIQQGINVADGNGSSRVLVSIGTYSESTITMANGVSVSGGFDPIDFTPDAGTTTLDSNSTVAIQAVGIGSPTTIEKITVLAQAAGPGGSSYGVRVDNSTGLVIRNADITAGDGGNGSNGSNGSAGANGDSGNSGSAGGGTTGGSGGGGGANFCNFGGANGGGSGGSGGSGSAVAPGTSGGSGSNGTGAAGAGGGGGSGCTDNTFISNTCPFGAAPGSSGSPGASGSNGGSGAGGNGTGTAGPVWSPSGGASGSNGTIGAGGGGGGGGGGQGGLFVETSGGVGGGGGGGGGGEGGCYGFAGAGGTGGGASFGVYAWDSTVTVTDSTVTTGDGGNGGNSGTGGSGGNGGSGGSGGAGNPAGDGGGSGGAGGDGGDAGDGGGGGGGVAFALYEGGTSVVTDAGGNTLNAGSGGSAGAPNGAPGDSGPVGP